MSQLYPKGSQPFQNGQRCHWGALYGNAYALALIEFAKEQNRPILFITRDIKENEQLYQTLRFYNTHLHILKFDNWEVLPFDHFSPHPDLVSNRLQVLSQLPGLDQGIVVTTLETLCQRLCPVNYSNAYTLMLKVGEELILEDFRKKLHKIGYQRVNQVMEHGEFSIRGSLIDLYPMGAKSPYRIDLFDNEIESIRLFDTSSQRSIESVESVQLLPGKEFPTDQASLAIFKENYFKIFNNRDDFIYTEIDESRLPSGIDFYLPLFFNNTSSLFDYLDNNTIIATHQGVNELIEATYDSFQQRYISATQNIDRPPLPVEDVFLSQNELFTQIKKAQQVRIQSSKIGDIAKGLNFNTALLPPVAIESQASEPLVKLLNFIGSYDGRILFVFESAGRQNLLTELLAHQNITLNTVDGWEGFLQSSQRLCITRQELLGGFSTPAFALITETDLFGSEVVSQKRRRRAKHKDFDEAIKSLIEIKIGDPIVHENYGVGRYRGLKSQTFDGNTQDFLLLEYQGGSKLMVPMTSLNLISRYTGVNPEFAPLHKLGTNQWHKAKKKASEALYDVAAELLEIYAKRAAQKGFACDVPSDAYHSFVASFQFEETPDQLKTMEAVLADMCAEMPMDRLVCGDVGFGKTEIAMRAAFLAVESGKQVAILVPTTLLASQHHQSFVQRFANYPIEIESLSRFQTQSEQKIIKQKLKAGKVDIIIGTHKLIQGNVEYQNLGLVIIDEEHRFGVRQKETLKKVRGKVDILTMTATPIPRTLNMALGSLRELSVIATPPQGRSAIKTFVNEWSDQTIIEACNREIHRGGQIFVLHNDIDSIDNMAESIQNLMPNIRIRIAHGQMPSKELENIMADFYHGRFQLLVCTTIIETGIDIPNANTIIINNAQNFGLAQLHQLRGRVGRSHHRAYAYLVIKSFQSLSTNAKKRLDAIESLEELGAGFMLANHDLEIRGAGDLLGENQSGKITEIGFNLYLDLLKRSVLALKSGKKIDLDEPIHNAVEIDSGISAVITDTYVADVHERLVLYKRIASAKDNTALKDLQIEMIDRFGLLPDATKNLFAATRLKLFCEKIGIDKIAIYDDRAILTFGDKNTIEPIKIINLVQKQAQKYQLKGQNQLIFKQEMPQDIERIELIENLLKNLN